MSRKVFWLYDVSDKCVSTKSKGIHILLTNASKLYQHISGYKSVDDDFYQTNGQVLIDRQRWKGIYDTF